MNRVSFYKSFLMQMFQRLEKCWPWNVYDGSNIRKCPICSRVIFRESIAEEIDDLSFTPTKSDTQNGVSSSNASLAHSCPTIRGYLPSIL